MLKTWNFVELMYVLKDCNGYSGIVSFYLKACLSCLESPFVTLAAISDHWLHVL